MHTSVVTHHPKLVPHRNKFFDTTVNPVTFLSNTRFYTTFAHKYGSGTVTRVVRQCHKNTRREFIAGGSRFEALKESA